MIAANRPVHANTAAAISLRRVIIRSVWPESRSLQGGKNPRRPDATLDSGLHSATSLRHERDRAAIASRRGRNDEAARRSGGDGRLNGRALAGKLLARLAEGCQRGRDRGILDVDAARIMRQGDEILWDQAEAIIKLHVGIVPATTSVH